MQFITQGKTNWKFLIIVAILAVIASGGIFWWTRQQTSSYIQAPINFSTQEECEEKTGCKCSPVDCDYIPSGKTFEEVCGVGFKKGWACSGPKIIDETADWQTYTWNKIVFNYPLNWKAEDIYYQTAAQQIKGESPENIGVKLFPNNQLEEKDFIAIGGHQVSCDSSENHAKCQFISYISNVIYTDSSNLDILDIFDRIVSTLSVVSDETVDWQTYSNEEYGFEIKYPENWCMSPNPMAQEPSQLFCPQNLCENGECEWKNNGLHMPSSYAPIYLFISELEFIPGSTKEEKEGFQYCEKNSITINNINMDIRRCDADIHTFWEDNNGKYLYHLMVTGYPESNYENDFNQMLSTFRFVENEKYCETDADCACGKHINTGDCFYGNRNYVNTLQQCPDFCTGIGGNLVVKCIDQECKQIVNQ